MMTYVPLCDDTLDGLLEYAAAVYQGKTAISMGKQYITYAQLNDDSKAIAKELNKKGISAGCHCALIGRNSIRWIVYFFALVRIGAVVIPLNQNDMSDTLKDILTRMDVDYVFAGYSHKKDEHDFLIHLKSAVGGIKRISNNIKLYLIEDDICEIAGTTTKLSYNSTDSTTSLPKISSSQTAVIMMTSGTTGLEKGVMLSHYNLFNNSKVISKYLDLTEKDKMCLTVSLFHIFGLSGTLLSSIHSGSELCIPEKYSTAEIVNTIQKKSCSAINGVPTMFYNILNYVKKAGIKIECLQKGEIAGTGISAELFKKIVNEMKMDYLMTSYGLTETSPAITFSTKEDSIECRSKTVGKVLPHIDLRIRDIHSRNLLATNEIGEIEVLGYNLMRGYYNDLDANRNCFTEDGWLKTGDIGLIDENGYVVISGRKKELIIRGGENISPIEIENCILTMPQVEHVKVFSIEDAKYQEEICACIILKENTYLTKEAVRQYVNNHIEEYKCPRYVLFLSEFPYTASGKIALNELRKKINLSNMKN